MVCTGVKMQILNQTKNIICTLVVQNIGYFCKELELLDWQRLNFSHIQMKSRPKKDQKTIFCQWSNSLWKRNLKYPNICFQFLWAQIFAGGVLEDLFNSSPKLWRFKGKGTTKAWLYEKFCVSYQLVQQICTESETEPKQ